MITRVQNITTQIKYSIYTNIETIIMIKIKYIKYSVQLLDDPTAFLKDRISRILLTKIFKNIFCN